MSDEVVEHEEWTTLAEAVALLEKALALLDENGAPPRIGAQIDLALNWLQEHLGSRLPRP